MFKNSLKHSKMNKTMKKKCEETTTVTLYIKHALFGCIKWSWNGVQIVLPLFNLVSQKQNIFIYDQPTVRLPCLDQKLGPKLSDVTTVTSPTRWAFSVSDLTENLYQILPRVITKSTFNICPQKLFLFYKKCFHLRSF